MADLYRRLKLIRERQLAEHSVPSPQSTVVVDKSVDSTQPVLTQENTVDGFGAWTTSAPLVRERTSNFQFESAAWEFLTVDLDVEGREQLIDSRHQCLFLDTETTGLSGGAGTWAFLIGWCRLYRPIGHSAGSAPFVEVRQFFLQDLGGEPEFVQTIDHALSSAHGLETFNGASFDLPLMRMRWALNGRELPVLPHRDCLHPARRLWKNLIGSCRLGAIEMQLLGICRHDDVPGALVPELYFAYLRSGAGEDFNQQLEGVFRHHAQDVYSLSVLSLLLDVISRTPRSSNWKTTKLPVFQGEFVARPLLHPQFCAQLPVDPWGLLRLCNELDALALVDEMWNQYGEVAWGLEYARRLYRGGSNFSPQIDMAVAIWRQLWDQKQSFVALLRLLKYWEHTARNVVAWDDALTLIAQARRLPQLGQEREADLIRRQERINRKRERLVSSH